MLINGRPSEHVNASDRGLQYGDGLFETIAVVDGEPKLWDRHMARLSLGEARLGIPSHNGAKLLAESLKLAQGKQRAVLKIIITRGAGGRGYRPAVATKPTRILNIGPWPDRPREWYLSGIGLRICKTQVGRNKRLAGIKHLNRLEQVLARQEWDDPNIPEGLMLDEYRHVIEGTQSNLFLLQGETLLTPKLTHAGVAGVVRDLVLDIARELGLETLEADIPVSQITEADALFLTNSLLGLCPVAHVEGRYFDIGCIPSTLREMVQARCLGPGSGI